jgi:hypothetical protein
MPRWDHIFSVSEQFQDLKRLPIQRAGNGFRRAW